MSVVLLSKAVTVLRVWKQLWEKNDPNFFQPVVMNGLLLIVLGYIATASVGKLTIVEGTINAARCCTMLDESLLPSVHKCFDDKDVPFIF